MQLGPHGVEQDRVNCARKVVVARIECLHDNNLFTGRAAKRWIDEDVLDAREVVQHHLAAMTRVLAASDVPKTVDDSRALAFCVFFVGATRNRHCLRDVCYLLKSNRRIGELDLCAALELSMLPGVDTANVYLVSFLQPGVALGNLVSHTVGDQWLALVQCTDPGNGRSNPAVRLRRSNLWET